MKDLIIQSFTRGAASHVAVMGRNEVFDAVGSGIRQSKLTDFVREYSYVAVIRPLGLTMPLREKLGRDLYSYHGSYNYLTAIKTSVRTLERDVKYVLAETIVRKTTPTYICSDFVRHVFVQAGLPDPGLKGRVSTPSDFANENVGDLAGYLVAIDFHAHDTSRTLSDVDDMARDQEEEIDSI
ncbi:hypothetical protein ELH06_12440 [Rhizobium ruizarguesonis]|uniref:hypothetical protein n=1 Tax=Rhizobium ruizarguesonis TaxID=2081791 RepID=UPI0010304427|nr:hypothetical protein [Rhizobium ruizarguesonis]TBE49912.1 hypothetical protein ELH06_12440 [Rhizobium ruizarguesonis]